MRLLGVKCNGKVEKLRGEMNNAKNNETKENEISKNTTLVDLDEFVSCGASYEESIRKLQELKGILIVFNTPCCSCCKLRSLKDWEYQKYEKVQYDIFQLFFFGYRHYFCNWWILSLRHC